jgi:hypothetical protein
MAFEAATYDTACLQSSRWVVRATWIDYSDYAAYAHERVLADVSQAQKFDPPPADTFL